MSRHRLQQPRRHQQQETKHRRSNLEGYHSQRNRQHQPTNGMILSANSFQIYHPHRVVPGPYRSLCIGDPATVLLHPMSSTNTIRYVRSTELLSNGSSSPWYQPCKPVQLLRVRRVRIYVNTAKLIGRRQQNRIAKRNKKINGVANDGVANGCNNLNR